MLLIQCLMAFIVAYNEGNYPNAVLNAIFSKAARRTLLENIPGMANALAAYDAGEELDWAEMAQAVKDYADEYSRQPSSKSSFHKSLLLFVKYYKSGSESALAQIRKMSSLVDSQELRMFFAGESIDQGTIKKGLLKTVKQLGGDAGAIGLTQDQSKAAKLANPDLYKEYLAQRKQFSDAWKIELSNFVRESGEAKVPFQDVVKYLKKQKVEHTMPEGFTGLIDANGGWYAADGLPINGGAPSSVMFPKVRMNPEPSKESPWVFQAIRPGGEAGNYFYTEEFVKQQTIKKFAKVSNFDVDKTRSKWLPKIKSFQEDDVVCLASVVLELLFRTSNRIGTRIGGNPTGGGFGICTLLVAHVYPQKDGSIKFIYLGKDDVKTVSLIKKQDDPIAAQVCKIVLQLIEGKNSKDPVFSVLSSSGVHKPLQPAVVTAVFRKAAGDPEITAHKLRTAKGTRLFTDFMATVYAKYKVLDSKQAMELLKKGGEIVGKELNHVRRSAEGETTVQPMTSLKNYIDVGAQIQFFTHYRLPLPGHLENFAESATLAICRKVTAAAEDTKEGKEDVDVDTAQEDGVIGEDDYMDVEEARDLNLQPQRTLEEMLTEDPVHQAYVGDSGWDQ